MLQRSHKISTKPELSSPSNEDLNMVLEAVHSMLPAHLLKKHAFKARLAAALRAEPALFANQEELEDIESGKLWSSSIWRDLVRPQFFGQEASTAWKYHPKLEVNQTSNEHVCQPPVWLQNRTTLWLDVRDKLRPVDAERLGWTKPYPSIRATYTPSFNVCTRPVAFNGDSVIKQAHTLMFFPGVDDGSEHDCDTLPMLMEAVGQKANVPDASKAVAVDVGASEGMCTLLLLSKGYTVYSYEPAPLFQVWRKMSVDANPGFASRVKLRAGLQGANDRGSKLTLDSDLLEASDAPQRIHLLKIDVDDVEASILHGGRKLLQSGRVDMVQMELWKSDEQGASPCSEKNCVVSNAKRKAFILRLLQNHGYQLYVMRAWGDREHPQVFLDQGGYCDALREHVHRYKDGQAGGSLGSQYQYGDHKVQALGLIPISSVPPMEPHEVKRQNHTVQVREKDKLALINCYSQFLAVHSSSPFSKKLHAGAFHLLHEDLAIQRLHV